MSKLAIALLTALVISGCGGPPSPSDGRKQLEGRIQAQSNGLIRLVSFDKTNGLDRDIGGRKIYEMEYTAEIEFLDNCMWSGGGLLGWDGSFRAVRGERPGGIEAFNPEYLEMPEVRKGQRKKVNGKFTFEKTEQGWRLAK